MDTGQLSNKLDRCLGRITILAEQLDVIEAKLDVLLEDLDNCRKPAQESRSTGDPPRLDNHQYISNI